MRGLRIPDWSTSRFLQFVREKCLVIVAEPRAFHLYIEDNVHLAGSIAKATGKQVFNYDRLGKSCIFAFDQTTRLLAIFHQQKVECACVVTCFY